MKLLYIEDSPEIGTLVTRILESVGHEVLWLKNRTELPASMAPFDAVLSDFEVPGGEFIDTKNACAREGVPLLLMSGNDVAASHHDNFLAKPFSPKEIMKRVQDLESEAQKRGTK